VTTTNDDDGGGVVDLIRFDTFFDTILVIHDRVPVNMVYDLYY